MLSGFVEKKRATVRFPDPPPITTSPSKASTLPPEAQAEMPKKAEQPRVAKNAKAIWSEVGYASWYGPDYHNRRGSNGEVYDMNAFTAAHRTIPLNSIVRVTNEKTGQVVVVRITDRGPFVTDRVLDLSGPRNDWWVRVRVPADDRKKAEEIARANSAPQGAVFLVRLD